MRSFVTLIILPLLLAGMASFPLTAAEDAASPDLTEEAAPAADDSAAADDGTGTTDDAENAEGEDSTLWQRFRQGGLPMVFLTALLILALAIIVERFINVSRGNFVSPLLMAPGENGAHTVAGQLWKEKRFDELCDMAESDGSALAQIVAFCARNPGEDYATINETAGDIAAREVSKHNQTTYWLAVVATLSPLLGLLGTVLGMIDSFAAIEMAGDIGDTSTVAGGIAKALVTTAYGLIIAVPALGAYHFFKGRISSLTVALEDSATQLIHEFYGKSTDIGGEEG